MDGTRVDRIFSRLLHHWSRAHGGNATLPYRLTTLLYAAHVRVHASADLGVQRNDCHRTMKYDDLEAKGVGDMKSLEVSHSPASLRQQKYCCACCGKYLGLFYMFMSAVCFSTMSMLVGFLGRVHTKAFPFTQLVFARGILCLVLAFAYIREEGSEE